MKSQNCMALLLLMTGLAVLNTGCSIRISDGYSFDYKGVKSLRQESGSIAPEIKSVLIENRFGDVKVQSDAEKPGWTWAGACWATSEEDATQFVDELAISVETKGNQQIWKVKLPKRDRKLRGVQSDLYISVPPSVDVYVVNKHGTTTALGLNGKVEIQSEHGPIVAEDLLGRNVELRNEHGKITASNLGSMVLVRNEHGDSKLTGLAGTLTLVCEHGDADVKGVKGAVKANLSHGSWKARDLESKVRLKSEHSNVDLRFSQNDFGLVDVDAEHSTINIYLNEDCHAKVNVSLDHGRVKNALKSNENGPSRVKVDGEHTNVNIRKN